MRSWWIYVLYYTPEKLCCQSRRNCSFLIVYIVHFIVTASRYMAFYTLYLSVSIFVSCDTLYYYYSIICVAPSTRSAALYMRYALAATSYILCRYAKTCYPFSDHYIDTRPFSTSRISSSTTTYVAYYFPRDTFCKKKKKQT